MQTFFARLRRVCPGRVWRSVGLFAGSYWGCRWCWPALGLGGWTWFVQGDSEINVDLPSADADFFDEETDETLALVEVELVYSSHCPGGEVFDTVA